MRKLGGGAGPGPRRGCRCFQVSLGIVWKTSVVPSAREATLCPREPTSQGTPPSLGPGRPGRAPGGCVSCGVTQVPGSAELSGVAGPEVQSSCCRRACVPAGLPQRRCPAAAGCALSPGRCRHAHPRVPSPNARTMPLQVYHCRPLALAFLELTVVRRFHEHTHQPRVPPPLRAVLRRLSALYALWSLSQHTALLYRGETPPRSRVVRSFHAAH